LRKLGYGVFLGALIALALFNGLRVWGNYLFSKGNVIGALAFDPNNYLYHFAAGTSLIYSKQSILAVEHLKRAVELNPGYTDSLSNLSVALMMSNNLDKAREVLKKLKQVHPEEARGDHNLKILEKLDKQSGSIGK